MSLANRVEKRALIADALSVFGLGAGSLGAVSAAYVAGYELLHWGPMVTAREVAFVVGSLSVGLLCIMALIVSASRLDNGGGV